MEIKVLGTGCARCRKLYEEVEQAIRHSGIPATLTKVEDLDGILAYGVMMTPALVIDEEVVSMGKVTKAAEIVTLIVNRTG
ncbi:MAG: TM0996/MTH895 family glutaredoxin-like protein [Deltaproteobacteria bacterium]|nr:TM0996/MTH895 family glutaredoxin-like protein [Deltaproteobacteria bacterium]